jgi:hypothetical protein
MTPKEVLTLLQIIDLSSQSPAYSAITAAAHEALSKAMLHVLAGKEEEEETEPNPPTRAPTPPPARRRT